MVGDGVGIGFAESIDRGRVRGRTTLGMEKERAMAAKEGNAGEGTDGCGSGELGRCERSCVLEREWPGGGRGGGWPCTSAQALGASRASGGSAKDSAWTPEGRSGSAQGFGLSSF